MKTLYRKYEESSGVSIDTRSISGGELFFCLKGENFNGNKFALQALDKGASYVVVDDADYFIEGKSMLLVDDSLKTLQNLSKYHRQKIKGKIIGITGTNGKTTTKELVSAVLTTHFDCLSTNGNFNNHIGVPLTLLRIKKDTELSVVEMGANHPNEIEELCEWVQPDFGLITNIGKAHLEGFGSFQNIIETKTALYRKVKQLNGTLFVNADDVLLMEKSEGVNRETYSSKIPSDFKVELEDSDGKLKFQWRGNIIQTQLFGEYNLYNAAAAITIGSYFKVPVSDIINALEEYSPSNNRSQFEIGENNELILDAYNANPDSMKQALNNFSASKAKNKAVILGDMLELGSFEEMEHKSILDLSNSINIDRAFFVGPAFYFQKENYPQFQFFKDNIEAKKYFEENLMTDYRILLKGSRGIKLEILKEQLL